MPTRNSRKTYLPDQYYHVYSRGIDKSKLFREEKDYAFFISLFSRYLSNKPAVSKSRVKYPHFKKLVTLNAYCLMSNHIHLLLYQRDEHGISKLMQSVMTSYSMYFNQKYKHYGPVFQGRFLASPITTDDHLQHITRYIHLNPSDFAAYPYSSIHFYLGSRNAQWLNSNAIMDMFSGPEDYMEFMNDYAGHQEMTKEISRELADQ